PAKPKSITGFSLVELSIVLVILGLLVGGVLTGRSLIRASELRSVNAEYSKYLSATQTFRDKYFALPGDMTNATSFWGDDNTYCADASIANGTPGTCNGNGAGTIDTSTEIFRYWQQLALSGLIEGSYSGVLGSAGNSLHHLRAVNAPGSRLSSSSLWAVYNRGSDTGSATMWTTQYGNALFIGNGTATSWPDGTALNGEEAWNIDKKIDDGMPGTGIVIGLFWPTCTNATTFTDYAATYRLSETANICQLRFVRAF
ncbi:MAG: type II secretion system protein, partial [Rickettsiales bacterium]